MIILGQSLDKDYGIDIILIGSTIIKMDVKFLSSAARHGFTQSDALSAIAHAEWVKDDFDTSRVEGNPDPTLWVGPALDGTQIEVMTFIDDHGDAVIFHCMALRDKFRNLMKGD